MRCMHQPDKQIGWPTIVGLGLVVVAFMALSLCVTATGTARFAVAWDTTPTVGYAVGAIFDIAKGVLPVGLLALWSGVRSAPPPPQRCLGVPRGLQLPGNARDGQHGHLRH